MSDNELSVQQFLDAVKSLGPPPEPFDVWLVSGSAAIKVKYVNGEFVVPLQKIAALLGTEGEDWNLYKVNRETFKTPWYTP